MEETYISFEIEMILDITLTFILMIEGTKNIGLSGSGYLVYCLDKKKAKLFKNKSDFYFYIKI
jgi:hypothetical protein